MPPQPTSDLPTGPGTHAVRRITARLLGLVVVLTAPAWFTGALEQRDLLASWWNVQAALVIGLPICWLLGSSYRARDVRPASLAVAVGVALCVFTWPRGVIDVQGAAGGLPWLWLILPLTMLALATWASVTGSLMYGVGVGAFYAWIRLEPIGGSALLAVSILEAVLLCALAVGSAVLMVGAFRSAARLDALADDAARAGAAAAHDASTVATRRELDTDVHDTVLVALHTATRDVRDAELPTLAAAALDTLTAHRSAQPEPDGGSVPMVELGRRLRVALATTAPGTELDIQPGPDVPSEPAQALIDAALEAVRNSRRHGGGTGEAPLAQVRIRPTLDGAGVQLAITDDGVGFDLESVPPQRMGLQVSVRERMRRVGGVAEIVSAPGAGTEVRLTWQFGGAP